MTIKAVEVDRDLHITLEGVAPYVVRPLPGRVGEQITGTYLRTSVGTATTVEMTGAFKMALDGAVRDPSSGLFIPLPDALQHNYNRAQDELRTAEAESVLMVAFLWQTILGISGVTAYIEGGEGVAGGVKALWALAARLGLSPQRTSPVSELDDLIQLQASSLSTSSPLSGNAPAPLG